MRIEFHPDAELELIEAAARYDQEVPGLGERFAAEVYRAINVLVEYPHLAPSLEGELRAFVLNRFPYTLIYTASPDVLTILVVGHQHRRPGYWRSRVEG
jgi:hypothetical protein